MDRRERREGKFAKERAGSGKDEGEMFTNTKGWKYKFQGTEGERLNISELHHIIDILKAKQISQ